MKQKQTELNKLLLKEIDKAKFKKTERLSIMFFKILTAEGVPVPKKEHQFNPERKWRFDFCWEEKRVALEVEGGIWKHGGHNRGTGFEKDVEKYNSAVLLGWRVVRCVPDDLIKSKTIDLIKALIK
jgi:hypothetical protein